MKKFTPYLLLLGSLACFGLGGYFREPMPLQHKIIMASAKEDGGVFGGTVIFIVRHDRAGAFGLVMNKGDFGGPVGKDEIYTLHSTDIMPEGSERMGAYDVAFASGDVVEALPRKPQWYKVVKGYAGWGRGQLDAEVRRGQWSVHDYNRALLED